MLPGIVAIVLFIGFVIAIIRPTLDAFVQYPFGMGLGFPEGESVIANIGLGLLNLNGALVGEGFLVALIVLGVVLDAALGGAVLLASRDEDVRGDE